MPIDVATGGVFTAAHDAEVEGLCPLIFRRVYDTRNLDRNPSVLGRGWLHAFDVTLTQDLDGFTFEGHEGVRATFDRPSTGFAAGDTILNLGEAMELRHEGDLLTVIHWHDVDTPTIRYVFERSGNARMPMRRMESAGQIGLILTYDGERLRDVAQSHDGRKLMLHYDRSGQLSKLSIAAPQMRTPVVVARYEYDQEGMLVAVYDSSGTPIRYAYDLNGRLIQETSRTNASYWFRYDDDGRCVETFGDGNRERRRFAYLSDSRTTDVADGFGATTNFEWNELGQIVQERRPNGAVFHSRFDDHGRIVSRLDPANAETTYAYDDRGNLCRTSWANGCSRFVMWNGDHLPVEIVDANNARWQIRYECGRPLSVVDPIGRLTSYQYDERGFLQSVTAPSGNVTHYRRGSDHDWYSLHDVFGLYYKEYFDAWNRCIELHGAKGLERRFTRDGLGRLIAEEDALGSRWQYTPDAEGRVVKVRRPDGCVQLAEYSCFGDLVRTVDAAGGVYSFEYDIEGRLVCARDPLGRTAQWAYDAVGEVSEITHFEGICERFERDLCGRVVIHHRGDGTKLSIEYDIMGHLSALRCGDRYLMRQEVDLLGRPVRVTSPDGVVEQAYDLLGRITSEVQNGIRVQYQWHRTGGIAQRSIDDAPSGPISSDFDIRGRLTAIADRHGVRERFHYDACDNLIQRELDLVKSWMSADPNGLLVKQELLGTSRDYRRDRLGRIAVEFDGRYGPESYEYDDRTWLVSSQTPTTKHEFIRDRIGNIQNRHVRSEEPQIANSMQGELRRDAAGRVVSCTRGADRWDFRWDELDRLIETTDPQGNRTRYGYDGFGRRVFKEQGEHRTDFFWAGDDLLQQRDDGVVVDFVISDARTFLIYRDGIALHAITDPREAIRELVDGRGNIVWSGTYGPLGELAASSDAHEAPDQRLAGQQYDRESGLHYNRYRYYEPSSGQYLSPDPINYWAGLNRYNYPPDPINSVDAIGLACSSKNNKGPYSVYVLENPGPPNQIVYVGITLQSPGARAAQHRSDGKVFSQMRVVQQGSCYRAARNLEGSALHHGFPPPLSGHTGPLAGVTGTLLNEQRQSPSNPGYYHSYGNPPGGNRTLLSAATVNSRFLNNLGIY